MDEPPIVNCHIHVFKVDDVQPKLARTIAPAWLAWMIDTRLIAGLFGRYTRLIQSFKTSSQYKRWAHRLYALRIALKRYLVLRIIKIVISFLILASIFHNQYRSLIKPLQQENNIHLSWLDSADDWLGESGMIIITTSWVVKALMVILFLILFPSGRSLLWFLLRKANSFVKLLPGKEMTEQLERFLNIIKFANYKDQSRLYSRLVKQYPPGSKMLEGNRQLWGMNHLFFKGSEKQRLMVNT